MTEEKKIKLITAGTATAVVLLFVLVVTLVFQLVSMGVKQNVKRKLESEIAYLQAENYADKVANEVYKSLDNKITANLEKLYGFVIDLDKRTALNAQGLHYENVITNNKIDCCCDKMDIKFMYENRLRDLADASIISYVNATFIPGTLKLPITSICPQPAVATTA